MRLICQTSEPQCMIALSVSAVVGVTVIVCVLYVLLFLRMVNTMVSSVLTTSVHNF